MKNSNFILIVVLVLALVFSCNTVGDHSEKIQSLDSLFIEVENADQSFAKLDAERIAHLVQSVEEDLNFVQKNYKGDMMYEPALLLSDYKSVTKIVKNFARRYTRIKSEIERTKKQLSSLSKALKDGATVDNNGNAFSDTYVEKVFNDEKNVAEGLIHEIEEMKERVKLLDKEYLEIAPKVKPILDSLKLSVE